ncbi:hypothetical protein DINM_003952 [Dirofilaria immitis]|nr:hypothetical protein [Dirofilaria immitis]
MAKSIRSKSKRRVRAIKRQRLAPRILKRLQATVSNFDCNKIKMEIDDDSNLAVDSDMQLVRMETSNENLNLKTMTKPDGSYPVWLSQRKRKKMKHKKKIKHNAKKKKTRRNR